MKDGSVKDRQEGDNLQPASDFAGCRLPPFTIYRRYACFFVFVVFVKFSISLDSMRKYW